MADLGTVENTSVERAKDHEEKDHGEGDARGEPASDFEGKIDARKKKEETHTKRKVTKDENRV